MPIKYNDYQFSQNASISCQFAPEYDQTGQTIIAHVYTLSIVDFCFPADDDYNCTYNDFVVDDLKNRLLIAGKELHVPGEIGLGTELYIQGDYGTSSDWQYDVNGGPYPQSCEIKNIGAGQVSQITYVIKFAVPPGCAGKDYAGGTTPGPDDVKALNWTNSFSIGPNGFTNRTTTGYVELYNIMQPQAGTNKTTVESFLADQMRGYVLARFPKIKNFARSFNWSMTADHKRLNFTITDKEIESPSAFPADVININMPTSVRFKWPNADSSKSEISINLRMTLSQTAPRVRAWEIFDALLEQRLGRFIANRSKGFLITSMTVNEDYFSNQYSFAVTATATSSIYDQMANLGLFQPIPSNWDSWDGSLYLERNGVGFAGIYAGDIEGSPGRFNAGETNLCNELPAGTEFSNDGQLIMPPPKFAYAACSQPPSPGESWINTDYNLSEQPIIETQVATTYAPVSVTQQPVSSEDPTGYDTSLTEIQGDYQTCINESAPTQRWCYSGYTQRVYYKIPCPVLTEIGGQPVKLIGQPKWRTRYLGKSFCLPVYEAEWYQEYVVADQPTTPDSDLINPTPDGQPNSETDGGQV